MDRIEDFRPLISAGVGIGVCLASDIDLGRFGVHLCRSFFELGGTDLHAVFFSLPDLLSDLVLILQRTGLVDGCFDVLGQQKDAA
jgi:hypothetical protein